MSASDLTPPAAAYSCGDDARELLAHDGLDLRDDLRAGLVHHRDPAAPPRPGPRGRASRAPGRPASCAGWRSPARSSAATRCAGRRAICSGGVRRRNSNGRRSIVAARRPMISVGALGAERALEHRAREVDAALGEVVLGEDGLDGLVDDGARRPRSGPSATWRSRARAPRPRLAERCLKTSVARSSPMATSSAAAFCAARRAWRPRSVERRWQAALIRLVLAHPLADLGGDALGLALHQLVEPVHARVGRRAAAALRSAAPASSSASRTGASISRQPGAARRASRPRAADAARHEEAGRAARPGRGRPT